MPELVRDDVSLHYEITGDGPPLLMLAGMLSDSASWAPLLPLLEPHFTLIRPDNRTTGRTTPAFAPASIDIFAGDALALLDHLNITGAHVLGHSMGGLIGMTLAQQAPSKISTLTLAASAPVRLTRNVALFRSLVAIRQSSAPEDTWLHALFPWLFAPAVYDVPGAVTGAAAAALAYPHAQSSDAMAHQIDALAGFDPTGLKSPDTVPTQALLAEDDLLIPLPIARPALGGIPQHIIANAGHSIHWDAPDAVAQHIFSFTGAS